MEFIEDYPNLFQFLGGYFPDADFEDLTDEEIVSKYVLEDEKNNSFQKINQLIADIESLMNNIENYWEEVGDEANRYFESPKEALLWLNMIQKELKK